MSTDPQAARTSYDEVPYASYPFAQTHPDRLATLGRLFGLEPAPVAACRVLELGCAAGGNLIPMATALPQAEFVGVDLSSVQVAEGLRIIEALGLRNIRLLAMSIDEVDERLGSFDYVLTHGVYSWVPGTVQEAILRICANQMRHNGIAYVSYNTLPGWRMRGMIRDLMRFHAMGFRDARERVAQARAILDFLAKSVSAGGTAFANSAYGMLLKSELEDLRGRADHYILHEHLEDSNEPLYFHEFMERAHKHGLQYLADADFSTMLATNFPSEVTQTLQRIAPDLIRQEQFMDFLRNRTFRQTLLVHKDVAVNRKLTPQRMTPLWVSGELQPAQPDADLSSNEGLEFRSPGGGQLTTPRPITKAALVVLSRHWPEALPFAELVRSAAALLDHRTRESGQQNMTTAEGLAGDLLRAYGAGLIELHATPSGFVTRPEARPTASPLARWQVGHGLTDLTTLRHQTARVEQDLGGILQLLDGSHDRRSLERAVADSILKGPGGKSMSRSAVESAARKRVDDALAQLGRLALLVA